MESSGDAQQEQSPSRQFVGRMGVAIALIVSAAVLALNTTDESARVVLDSSGGSEAEPSESLQPTVDDTTPAPSVTPSDLVGDQPIPTAEPGEIEPTALPAPADVAAPAPPTPPDVSAPALPDAGSPAEQPEAPPADPGDPAAPAQPDADAPADTPAPPPGNPADDTPQPLSDPVLPVGTCLVNTMTPSTVASVTPSSCDSEHTGEVYVSAVLPLAIGAAYPGSQSLNDQTRLLCQGAAFGQFVGREFNDGTQFLVLGLFPTEASWGAGDRDTTCYLYDLAGPRTSSARGSGL